MSANPRRRVAVVGATGVAGQQFLVTLDQHPWFEVTTLAASSRSAGKLYREAITGPGGQLRWGCARIQQASRQVISVLPRHAGDKNSRRAVRCN